MTATPTRPTTGMLPRNITVLLTSLCLIATTLLGVATPAAAQTTTGLILNEWNAVSQSGALDDGAVDPAFGVGLGNGGDWFELVVTQPGGLDIRGWSLALADTDNADDILTTTKNLVFSQAASLANVPAGTIITVSEDVPDNFDLSDFHMNLQSNNDDDGQGFTELSQGNFDTNSKNWQLTIRNASGQLVFGPVGEGVNPASGVGSSEVGKLEADPSNAITPQSPYNDGTNSTFGAPNVWGSGEFVQNFAALRGGAGSPTATAAASCQASDGRIDLQLINPTAATVSFLIEVTGLSPVTQQVNPGQAAAVVRTGVGDGSAAVTVTGGGTNILTQSFPIDCDLGTGNGRVILNEWNAVKGGAFLENGSTDTRLGRIAGNGGDWFELVVTDPGGVDMRGWSFELADTRNDANLLVVTERLVTSQISALSNIPAGTIVTVAESLPDDFNGSDRHINLQSNSLDAGLGFTDEGQSNFDTNSADWQLTIRDAAGTLVFGPAGEGAPQGAVFGNVSGFEVGKLEANPSISITPQSNYNDGSSSTFGAPNLWMNNAKFQDFSQWWGPNPDISLRSVDCSGGAGIVRVNVRNNYATAATITIIVEGQLSNYRSSKSINLAAGEESFLGFSGRPDELYNVIALANGAPTATLAGLTGSTSDGAAVHCSSNDVVIVDNRCDSGSGILSISERNPSNTTREFRTRVWYETQVIDDQAETGFGGIERKVIVAPNDTHITTISGRTQDIGVLLAARSGPPGFAWADGVDAGAQAVLIDCQGETAEVGVLVSCLQLNGRIDVFLEKPESTNESYRVTVDGPNGFQTVRTANLLTETSSRVTVTGRPDGAYPLTVEKLIDSTWTELPVTPSSVVVSCDAQPTIDVTVRSTCLASNGRIDVILGNTTAAPADFVVSVMSGLVGPRNRTVDGFQRSTVTVTGRPDGTIPVTVTKDGVPVYSGNATVACD